MESKPAHLVPLDAWLPTCSLLLQSHPLHLNGRIPELLPLLAFCLLFCQHHKTHKCHVEKQESLNPQQWAQHRLEHRNIPLKLLQQAPRSCWSTENFQLGQKPLGCFSTPEHPHCCCVFTAHFTVWHESVQNWPLYQGGRVAQLPAWTQELVNLCLLSYQLQFSTYPPHTQKRVLHQAISHRWHLVFSLLTHKKYHAERVLCTKKDIFNHNECREFHILLHNQWLHYCFLKSIYSPYAFSYSKSNPPPGTPSFPAVRKTSTVPHLWAS